MAEILVVDDEIGIRELLSEILGDEGHSVHSAENAGQARQLREENRLDLVLLDIWMPDTDGITLLKEWAAAGKLTMPVIMMSGHATIDTAVEATRIGALDFLEKPITMQKLLRAVETGLQRGRAAAQPSVPPAAAGEPSRQPAVTAFVPAAPVGEAVVAEAPQQAGAERPAGFVPAAGAQAEAGRTQAAGASILLRELPLDLPLREARDAFERAYFEYHLGREQGSMTRVAERTGLERTHLYRKLKQLGIDLSRGLWRRQGG
ncbi:response regulator [Burkholderiaceae bacterium FT117]|uniref:response regulator n=1 Tax=Zeimonas sediminis TaxID=2944268 RepID=UPI002342E1D8|nr:response regulator [Zeimonas sediminis]MCM5571322.1 response regulator [Zeimonas sediminis]